MLCGESLGRTLELTDTVSAYTVLLAVKGMRGGRGWHPEGNKRLKNGVQRWNSALSGKRVFEVSH
jgi:hypothetical protein